MIFHALTTGEDLCCYVWWTLPGTGDDDYHVCKKPKEHKHWCECECGATSSIPPLDKERSTD